MEDRKDLFTSKTFNGAVLMVLLPILSSFGIELGDAQQLATTINNVIGVVLIIWGRVTAKKAIGSVLGIGSKSR